MGKPKAPPPLKQIPNASASDEELNKSFIIFIRLRALIFNWIETSLYKVNGLKIFAI